ncbi:DNA-3-methyladenine glycosylase family protein, partial [Bacteroidota bacterium]
KDLADKLITNKINLKNLVSRTDEEIITELTQVKGIGVWTVHMFLIFTLGRLNVLPYSDLGIKKAILLNYNLRKLPDEQKIIKLAQKNNWSPYNSIAALYLWKTLESK